MICVKIGQKINFDLCNQPCLHYTQFYSSIGFGHSLQKAFNQAKAALLFEGIPEDFTPQLFVQDGLSADELYFVDSN